MTDNTRVSDGNSAAETRTQSDNFDRTELFNSFGKTASEQSSTDRAGSGTDSTSTTSSDNQFNKSDATDNTTLQTNQIDKQNGERTNDPTRQSDGISDSESLNVSNVFEELGLTRGLANQDNINQLPEGNNSNLDRSALKGAEQQLPQLAFFDSASASATASSRSDVSPQRNRGREQQPGGLRHEPRNRQGDRTENRQKLDGAKPQNGLQVENLGASKEFAAKVQNQIKSLSPETRAALERGGVEIVTTDKLTSVRPDLKGKEPYNQPGAKFENLDAFYLPNSKTIVIAETRENQAGNTVPNNRVEGVFKHEVGHALDATLGNFSQKPEFVEAHKKDTEKLNESGKTMFNYLIGSKDGDGKAETFAEVWGALNGASSDPQDSQKILQKFPNVAKLIKEQLPKFIKK